MEVQEEKLKIVKMRRCFEGYGSLTQPVLNACLLFSVSGATHCGDQPKLSPLAGRGSRLEEPIVYQGCRVGTGKRKTKHEGVAPKQDREAVQMCS